jgi:ElaB/YqjD/DUF883 family membrane-anchored ribosome-binding protein
MEHEERIQQEMQETRVALAEKLILLEGKVAGTVEQVTTAVTDTVEAIKDSVQETKATVSVVNETVQDSVKSMQDCLDVNAQVQAHPWWVMAGSVAAGFCLGTLLKNREPPSHAPQAIGSNGGTPRPWNGGHSDRHRNGNGAATTVAKQEPSMFAAEVDKLKGLALGALFGTAREMIAASLPEPVNQQVKEIIDNVTKKAGGEPIPSSAFAKLLEPKPAPEHYQTAQVHVGRGPHRTQL